jgi:hypothetical protein
MPKSVSEKKEEMVTKSFKLKYQPVSKVAESLEKLKSKKGEITIDEASNTVTISDFPSVIESIERYIKHIDLGSPLIADRRRGSQEELSKYEEAIRADREDPSAWNNLGVAYYNKGDYEKAIRNLRKAIKLYPNYALAHHNLAYAYYAKGGETGKRWAQKMIKKARLLAPLDERIEKTEALIMEKAETLIEENKEISPQVYYAEKLLSQEKIDSEEIEEGNGWTVSESPHFIFYHRGSKTQFDLRHEGERVYKKIIKDISYGRKELFKSINKKVKIYICKDRASFLRKSGIYKWAKAFFIPGKWIIMLYQSPDKDYVFDETLTHELTHMLLEDFMRENMENVPLWLNEGLAMFEEYSKDRKFANWTGNSTYLYRKLKKGEFMNLEELFLNREDRSMVNLFYKESQSIVAYLINSRPGYRKRFTQMLLKIKEGKNLEEALTSSYSKYKSLEDLNEEWVKFIKDKK